jgi:hypothetical protein
VAQHEVLGITEPGSWWECRAGPKGATPKGRPLARSGPRPLPDLPPSGNNRSRPVRVPPMGQRMLLQMLPGTTKGMDCK